MKFMVVIERRAVAEMSVLVEAKSEEDARKKVEDGLEFDGPLSDLAADADAFLPARMCDSQDTCITRVQHSFKVPCEGGERDVSFACDFDYTGEEYAD